MRTIKTLPKRDGEIRCPYPDCCIGVVVEVDVAVRWNRLTIEDGEVRASTAGDYSFERRTEEDGGPGFMCDTCLRGVHFDPEPDIRYD
jgi:hypothetical protein